MRVQQLIEDALNKRSAKHANKSTLLARGADTQLHPSCLSAPLTNNVYLWNPILMARLYNLQFVYCYFYVSKQPF